MQWFNRFRSQLNTNDGPDSDAADGADAPDGAYLALWRKHRWMFIALLAALVIGGGWMIQNRRPAMEALSGFVVPDPAAAVRQLSQRGLTARLVNGQVEVRQDQQHQAIAVLQQEHLLTADSSDAFDRMIEQQSIWTGERQKQREFLIAKAKMLSGIIGGMRDVRSAVVMLDLPQRRSFGPSRQRPSASVSVTMTTGVEVDRNLVESIGSLVSGAVTGMSPEDVMVIDMRAARRMVGRGDEIKNAQAGSPTGLQTRLPAGSLVGFDVGLQATREIEAHYQQKISEALRYISGVIITVSVHGEVTDFASGGEIPISVPRGAGRFSGAVRLPGAGVHVTINVPRSFIEGLYCRAYPDLAGRPIARDVEAMGREQLTQIQTQIQPLVEGQRPSRVTVYMFDDTAMNSVKPSNNNNLGSLATMLNASWARPAALAMLAATLMGFLILQRRRGRSERLSEKVCEVFGPNSPNDNPMGVGFDAALADGANGPAMNPPAMYRAPMNRAVMGQAGMGQAGVGQDRSFGPGTGQLNRVTRRPFSFFRGSSAQEVRQCLESESKADVATALSYLPYGLTQQVLQGFGESDQHEIVRLIATMDEPDLKSIEQLEHELAIRLADMEVGQPFRT